MKKRVALVVAMSVPGRVIGKGNALPWHLPEDMKHFRATTMGHAIIMGRKTHESIGKALSGRQNIVVSRSATTIEGCEIARTIDEAITLAKDDEPRVIGGAEIYALALPIASRIYLTEVRRDVEGDAHLPPLGPEWKETDRRKGETLDVEFVVLERLS